MVAGNIVDFYFNIMVDLFQVPEDPVMGTDHPAKHGNGFLQPLIRFFAMTLLMEYPHFLEADIDENIIGQEVVLSPPFIGLAGKDGFAFHHLEVVDDRLREKGSGYRISPSQSRASDGAAR